MTRSRQRWGIVLWLLGALIPSLTPAHAQQSEGRAATVEPTALIKRPDLVDHEVVVDDRVRYFQHHPGIGFDQLFLKRTEIPFELPTRLRPSQSPSMPAVEVRGILRRRGDRYWVEVTSFRPMTSDLDRLNRGVALLPKSDVEAKMSWARWAEQRADAFDDEPLRKRAREIEIEAIRAESDRPTGDGPTFWLGLADRARARKLPVPEAEALAHRGFRAALTSAKTAAELAALTARIEAFFPEATKIPEGAIDLERWEKPYANAPADAYRAVSPEIRKVLDHRLWADATQRRLERQGTDDPNALVTLSEEAARLIPDRPLVARSLLETGLTRLGGDVASLRQTEVENLARLYRDVLHQPEEGKALVRSWLDDQRTRRLSAGDAEGRLLLADQYESMLGDRASAIALLREAEKLDPNAREVTEAFRRRGFQRIGSEWVERERPTASEPVPNRDDVTTTARADEPEGDAAEASPRSPRSGLLNASPEEVRARFGSRPTRKLRVATQGQVAEQWIYLDPKFSHHVTFQKRAGDLRMRVISYFSLPRTELRQ